MTLAAALGLTEAEGKRALPAALFQVVFVAAVAMLKSVAAALVVGRVDGSLRTAPLARRRARHRALEGARERRAGAQRGDLRRALERAHRRGGLPVPRARG